MALMRVGDAYQRINQKYYTMRAELAREEFSMSRDTYLARSEAIDKAEAMEIRELDAFNRRQRDNDLRPYVFAANSWGPIETDTHPLHDAEVRDGSSFIIGVEHMNILKTKVIGVKFLGNGNTDAASYEKMYHYFTDDMSIAKDDYCIVIGASGAPCVVKVYDDAVISKAATKMVVGKIDLTEYNEKLKTMVARSAAIKRLKEIEEEQSVQEKYKHLAATSDEAKQLLKMLGMLSGGDTKTQIEQSGDTQGKTIDG